MDKKTIVSIAGGVIMGGATVFGLTAQAEKITVTPEEGKDPKDFSIVVETPTTATHKYTLNGVGQNIKVIDTQILGLQARKQTLIDLETKLQTEVDKTQ